MKTCAVIRPVTLTVQPGSKVVVSDEQYRAASDSLEQNDDERDATVKRSTTKKETGVAGTPVL